MASVNRVSSHIRSFILSTDKMLVLISGLTKPVKKLHFLCGKFNIHDSDYDIYGDRSL